VKVVSFYTDFYAEPAAQLKADLEAIGVALDIRRVEDRGSWRLNVCYKPQFIADMLRELDDDLLFLDADTRVQGEIEFPADCDIALRYSAYSRQGKREPLCGALFLRNTEKVRAFADAWAEAMKDVDDTLRRPDQQTLREMLPDSGLAVLELGKEYGLLQDEAGKAFIVTGRWTNVAGSPPISKAVVAEKERKRDEQRSVRGEVDQARKRLVKRKKYQAKISVWDKFRIARQHRAAISLTFDDGRASQFEVAARILDEFDIKGTFYVCPGLVQKQRWEWPRPAGNVIELASWPEIEDASVRGHEIGNHSWSHPNFPELFAKLNSSEREARMKQECAGSASALAHRLNKAHFSFAWPYHRVEPRVLPKIHHTHTGIRQLQPRGVYNMKGSVKEWRRRMKEFVDMLIAEKQWGQAVIHDVGDTGHNPLPVDILRWHLEDLRSRKEIEVVRVTDMYKARMAPMPPCRGTKRQQIMGSVKPAKRLPKRPKREPRKSRQEQLMAGRGKR
jgi:hypothetical protein